MKPIWFKLRMTVRTPELLNFDTTQCELELDSRSQECEKAKTSGTVIL